MRLWYHHVEPLSVWFAPMCLCFRWVDGGGGNIARAGRAIREEGERSVDYQKLAALNVDQLLPWLKTTSAVTTR